MKATPSAIPDVVLIEPKVFGDARGFFFESFNQKGFAEATGYDGPFVQDNHSRSATGTVRGIHFSRRGQAKLVRCTRGSILDVLVDLRRGSPTFGQWEGFELDDRELRILYCPVGFGHGFCVTSDVADVVYKLSSYYDAEFERGIAYDDADVGIAWPDLDLTVSERDATAPRLRDVADELPFEYGGT